MSLILATLSEDGQSARLAVDTLGQSMVDGGHAEILKVYTLPQVPAVLAGRGQQLFLFELFRNFSFYLGPETFDALLADFGAVVDGVFEVAAAHTAAAGHQLLAGELALVGWSEQKKGFIGVSVAKEAGTPASVRPMVRGHVAPWDIEAMGPCPLPSSPQEFLAAASAQVRFGIERFPGEPLGGRLLLTELAQRSLSITDLGLIPA